MSIVQRMNCKYAREREGGEVGRMGGWMAECVGGGWLTEQSRNISNGCACYHTKFCILDKSMQI